MDGSERLVIYRGIISMENGIRLKKLHSNKNQLSSKYLLLNNPKFLNVCLLKQRRRLQLTFFQSKE